ncbi:MAG TPA: response regulator [Rhodocyclaceae bacterium]|jgi:chemosensory pili system protein ChpA (sensor histidine kinase/response regulator)
MLDNDFDIGPLSWVKGELDLALGRAETQLLRKKPGLKDARACLHRCRGALTVVGLEGVTLLATAIEQLLDALVEGEIPWSPELRDEALAGIATLSSYLDGLLAGVADQPLALYPAYRRLILARQLPAPSPATLFFPDLSQCPPQRDVAVEPLPPIALKARLKAACLGFDRGLQKWLKSIAADGRGDATGLRDMRNSVAIVEQTRNTPEERAFWWICIAFCDGLKEDIADPDMRNLLQRLFDAVEERIQALAEGDGTVSEDLLREVLYQVAVADGSGADSESVRSVRTAYRLAEFIPREAADGTRARQRHQQLQALGKDVTAAQQEWERFCRGTAAALPPFHETCLRFAEQVDPGAGKSGGLGHVDLARLTTVIGNVATLLRKNPLAHSEALAEEMVTALLLLEATVEELSRPGGGTGPEFRHQVETIGTRLIFLLKGVTPPVLELTSLDTPLLLTLSRRARDKALLARVCGEMKKNLAQVEEALDSAFRKSDHPELLAAVPLLLKQVEGALMAIEQPAAARTIAGIMAGMARLSYPGRAPLRAAERNQGGQIMAERLAVLNAFIAALSQGRSDPSLLDALPPVETFAAPGGVAEPDAAADAESPSPDAVPDAAVLEELLDIFLEEADAVMADLSEILPELKAVPEDARSLRILRRCFHTLKGSARMATLADFGETAWAGEQALNSWMDAGIPVSTSLFALLEEARQLFSLWIYALRTQQPAPSGAALAAKFRALTPPTGDEVLEPEPAQAVMVQADDEEDDGEDWDEDDEANVSFDILPPELESGIDAQLLPLFLEESEEAVAAIAEQLRVWRADPDDAAAPARLARQLHTLKGSARMVGALGIGELMHGLEDRIAAMTLPGAHPDEAQIDELEDGFDRAVFLIDELRGGEEPHDVEEAITGQDEGELQAPILPGVTQLRIRSEWVDQLINEAGEVAIARTRIEGELRDFKAAMGDLGENVDRLRHQLREIEIQAESQRASRQAQSKKGLAPVDSLEADRFTRLQELTRMMAESVSDVATLQHSLMRGLEHSANALTAQSRHNRDLSQGLLRIRLLPFSAIAERLQRVVRQTAKELGKRAQLTLVGAQVEVDRSVLERLVAPLEHLLRNALAHGIEDPAERRRQGKDEEGLITLTIVHKGNEFSLELADDGAGLDLQRIRKRGEASGLIAAPAEGTETDEAALTSLIFLPGFTTATNLSAVAGRGVGMDVVRHEVLALGGRIDVNSEAGRGCRFLLTLPVTLAIGQALLVRVGDGEGSRVFGIPAGLVEQATEVSAEDMDVLRREGAASWMGRSYDWHYLPRLLGRTESRPPQRRRYWRVLLRSGTQQIALEVDALLGNQEVVLKPIGPQLERVPGIAGATVLGEGDIALIVNPLVLALRQGRLPGSNAEPAPSSPDMALPAVARVPSVLVVDDSLTVRKTTSRLLERAGYHVVIARDGVEALARLQDDRPDVMLADIEMPRMDGFELVRNLRGEALLKDLPVIMISSRSVDKNRDQAAELGVEHFLGKPCDEAELLALIARYATPPAC